MKKFTELTLEQSLLNNNKKASFVILYSKDFLPNSDNIRILISMRWNSYLGFVGGLRDNNESPIQNIIRETKEEINFDLNPYKNNIHHLVSHFYEEKNMNIDTFECEISPENMQDILKNWTSAQDSAYEVAGVNAIFSTHAKKLIDAQWAGSGKEEFKLFLTKHNL